MSIGSVDSARPPGYAPRGTSLGLAGFTLLSVGTPFITLQSFVPVLTNGLDIWIDSIFPVVGFAMTLCLIMSLGLYRRRYWYIRYMFSTGALLLLAFLAGASIGLAVLLRLVPLQHPDLHFISIINIIMWLVLAPFAWLLLRMLRLRYWQPWTRPDEWEPGDEMPPRWGMSPPPPASIPGRKRR